MSFGIPRPFTFVAVSLSFASALCSAPASAASGACAGISTASDTPLTTVRIASGLVQPLFVAAPPRDTTRLFIVEQGGKIRLVKDGVLQPTAFLDISGLTYSSSDGGGSEQGLLGLAFDPNYAQNGWFFVYHTDASWNNLLVRYSRSATDPDRADPASRQVVTTYNHPGEWNHNGGMLAFGPDGYLYIGTGDGGNGCDPPANAQNPSSPLGKLHRIDVRSLPYTVPSTNPFVGSSGYLPEIWALGLRNPWRFSFDRATGDLYIGDVGENNWEEIDFTPVGSAGLNYGWDRYEGSFCPNPSCSGQGSCTLTNRKDPVVQFDHGAGCSVTGGYVYRGCRMPELHGTYFYSDYCSAFIHSFEISGGAVTNPLDRTSELDPGAGLVINHVTSFGEDARGEIYIVSQAGNVFEIVPVLANLEVSGEGAPAFSLGKTSWSWENLQLTSSQPIASYHVYRRSAPGNPFICVRQSTTPSWTGGDPSVPAPGTLYSYVVTAVNAAGEQTSPGAGSDGVPRVLSSAACP